MKRWFNIGFLMLLLFSSSIALAKLDGLEMGDRIYDISLTSRNDANGFPEVLVLEIYNKGKTAVELHDLAFDMYNNSFLIYTVDQNFRFLYIPLTLKPGEKVRKEMVFAAMDFKDLNYEIMQFVDVKGFLIKRSWKIKATKNDMTIINQNPHLSSGLVYSNELKFQSRSGHVE